MTTLASWLEAHSDLPRRDLELLLEYGHQISRVQQLTHPDQRLDPHTLTELTEDVAALRVQTPLAYILGHWEFYGLTLEVNAHTLIPRAETETLVDLVIQHLIPGARVLDVGTGSGAIAIAIAHTRRDCEVSASDISATALEVAQRNATRHGLRIEFRLCDWLHAQPANFHAVVSNPPYVHTQDPHLASLDHEPRGALTASSGGFADLYHLIMQAPDHLMEGGLLALEHGYDQGIGVRQLLRDRGYVNVATATDLAGVERVSYGTWRVG